MLLFLLFNLVNMQTYFVNAKLYPHLNLQSARPPDRQLSGKGSSSNSVSPLRYNSICLAFCVCVILYLSCILCLCDSASVNNDNSQASIQGFQEHLGLSSAKTKQAITDSATLAWRAVKEEGRVPINIILEIFQYLIFTADIISLTLNRGNCYSFMTYSTHLDKNI